MPSAGWIRVIIFLAAGSMFVLSVVTGHSIDQDGLRWIGGVTSAITLGVLAFERWIWRWPGVRWLVELSGHRVVRGTWRGTLKYEKDADGLPGEHAMYMAITQTYTGVEVHCYFPVRGSESWSLTASLERQPARHLLRYIYRQQAPAPERDRNRPTEGACELAVVGRPVEEISGSYYAERGGRGTLEFDGYCAKVAGSGPQAQRMNYRDLPK